MNNKLKSLLTFDEYKVGAYNSGNYELYFARRNAGLGGFEVGFGGVIYQFPARIESMGADEGLGGIATANNLFEGEAVSHYESFNSNFSRDWIDKILFVSGSIATQGEVVGNGLAVRKVITDFVLDPSTVRRDYLVYESKGTPRYYPLQSNSPLYKVDVFVSYQDIYGNTRRLEIEPNMCASIKVEFRPNNMVQYYAN